MRNVCAGPGPASKEGLGATMKTKIRNRKPGQKLLPQWTDAKEFAVDVRIQPLGDTRFLKNYTIAIHLDSPLLKRPVSGPVARVPNPRNGRA